MKKIILGVTFIAAFAFVAGYGVYASQHEVEMSDLVMDWNGIIVNKYQLNCFVKSIAVDEKNEIMYAITCGLDEDAKIVSFNLI